MIPADLIFKNNLNKILNDGYWDENPRPKYIDGTIAKSKFITGVFEEYDLTKNEYPITTLRNIAVKTGIREILWIYQKQTSSLKIAKELGINWWDSWNIGNETIGIRYGETVRKYDLMNKLLKSLEEEPFSRRHIINLYQYSDLNSSEGLHPCAFETLWSVRKKDNEYFLDLTLIQRSSDFLTAKSINSTQYLSLQMMVIGHLRSVTGLDYKLGKFCHYVNNLHIYDRHIQYIDELLSRESSEQPTIKLKVDKNFYDYTLEDFEFVGFDKLKPLSGKLELAI
jgi:thymidylate synthase